MSERGGDDAVRVPIKIKTEDLEEIQQLIQELTEAEENIRKAKTEEKGALPRRGKAQPDEVSKSPLQAADMDERGGIFGGTMEEAMPQKYKDKSSKTPSANGTLRFLTGGNWGLRYTGHRAEFRTFIFLLNRRADGLRF